MFDLTLLPVLGQHHRQTLLREAEASRLIAQLPRTSRSPRRALARALREVACWLESCTATSPQPRATLAR